jgi:hypothetical protein
MVVVKVQVYKGHKAVARWHCSDMRSRRHSLGSRLFWTYYLRDHGVISSLERTSTINVYSLVLTLLVVVLCLKMILEGSLRRLVLQIHRLSLVLGQVLPRLQPTIPSSGLLLRGILQVALKFTFCH